MRQYIVTGMHCAACSSRVERVVSALDGVTSVSVSLLTNSMSVEGEVADADIIDAVQKAGYGIKAKDDTQNTPEPYALQDAETPHLKKRLIASTAFLAILMYFSMGSMMWGWPLPAFFAGNHMAIGLIQLLLSAIIMVINQDFFISGLTALVRRSPNMDSLVALGSGVSFVWSVCVLFMMTSIGDEYKAMMSCMDELYFESAAMILTLITVGKILEAKSKGRTTDALKALMKLSPQTATVIRDGKELVIPIAQAMVGDVFVVRPGENIPLDGIVEDGSSSINEAALTGESIPVDKTIGSSVYAATTNTSGFLRCRATKVGTDTTLSQIIKMVSDAASTKAPIAKIADRVSGIFVPAVIGIAIITTIVWLLIGEGMGFALARGISVLVISCPCALGLATPVAIMVGNGVAARHGILFKTSASLEETGRTTIVALDKTGTITTGEPIVTDIIPVGISEDELLSFASSLESKSEHPLSIAILQKADDMNISYDSVTDFVAIAGMGLSGKLDGHSLYGGSFDSIASRIDMSNEYKHKYDELSVSGKTPLFFARDDELLGIIAVADAIKPDSKTAIKQLHDMNIKVVMITGDNENTARAIGNDVGVDEVIASVLPDGKEETIRRLQADGHVAMVGDGINDAPALARANTGIAIGAGSDIAIDSADVVLMNSKLSDVPAAIKLSRATLKNIHENLFWAFFYNIIGIPLAAGVWIPIFGWKLNPMFGAAAMSLSSFCVVTNALRLNMVRLGD